MIGVISWQWFTFDELGVGGLYDVLQLRDEVFVVEQRCAYLEADGLDGASLHLLGRDEAGTLMAYLRIVPPGAACGEPSPGRIVVRPEARGNNLGRVMIEKALEKCEKLYPGSSVRIHAQEHLASFYETVGFEVVGPPYDDFRIMHVEMVRPPHPPPPTHPPHRPPGPRESGR